MMDQEQKRFRSAGMFFIRTLLGIIFFMQGYGKFFMIGIHKVYESFFKVFEDSFLPKWLIVSTAYYTSFVELAGGFLLIAGLFRIYAMYLLALDLLIVSFGHGLIEPIWDLSHVIPRAILLSALFLLPSTWDRWNADEWIKNKTKLI
ncbi:MAG TPA: DoxX family protein [Chitinophagaceae bacterium]|nr:DoxX family protein [Chitinophagaceae bacterium]